MKWLALVPLAGCQLVFEAAPVGPADFAGSYRGELTNLDNGCGLAGFMPGMMLGITFDLLADERNVTFVTDDAIVGAILLDQYGDNSFPGTIDGNRIAFDVRNPTPAMRGTCSFNARLAIEGTLEEARVVRGRLLHTMEVSVDAGDCAQFIDCVSTQSFVATKQAR